MYLESFKINLWGACISMPVGERAGVVFVFVCVRGRDESANTRLLA